MVTKRFFQVRVDNITTKIAHLINEISILNNEIYSYTLSIKNKMINDRYIYNEQDYINLMDIIDNYSK